jgi:hypothetical protein
MEWTTRETCNRHRTRGERERERERGEERRGEEKEARGAESHSLLRVSLPLPRQTSTPPHAPPTKFTNPPEAQKFPWEEKSRPKSGAPNPSDPEALPRARPESRKSLLKFPNPPWAAAAAASLRPTRLPVAAAAADFHPRCFVSLPLCYCRHELSRPARHRGPSRAREARGSLPRKSPLVERRHPLFLAAPALCWYLSGVGGGDPPGRGSIPLDSVVSNPSLLGRIVKGLRFVLVDLRIC